MKSPALPTLKAMTGTESTARQTLHNPLPQEIPMPLKLDSDNSPKTTARPSDMGVGLKPSSLKTWLMEASW